MSGAPKKKSMDIRSFFAKRPRPADSAAAAQPAQPKKKVRINLDSSDDEKKGGASSSTKPAANAIGIRKLPANMGLKKAPTPSKASPPVPTAPKAKGKAGVAKKKAAAAPPPKLDANAKNKDNKFLDKTFVFTGVTDEISREDAIEKVKSAGGKVTSAVSGKTDYLVAGSVLEDGRTVDEGSKYRKAQEQLKKNAEKTPGLEKPKILDEKAFLAMFGVSKIVAPTVSNSIAAAPNPAFADRNLWTDKYRPHLLTDLVGNANAVKKIQTWLRDWHDVIVNGNKKPVNFSFRPGGAPPENPNARAVLVSGPPGIGKTTAIGIIAKESGYVVLEYNASDARTKKIVDGITKGLSDSHVLVQGEKGLKKCCIIMDECDGMAGGDRGGNAALIQMVKNTKVPIFCICNDRMDPKIRNLANSCYDIKFQRPPKAVIAKRLAAIAKSEGVEVEMNGLETMTEQNNNDIRQVVNQLQMMQIENAGKAIRFENVTQAQKSIRKDALIAVTPFDAAKKLLMSSCRLSINERLDLFFVDYGLVPGLVHQNYLSAVKKDTKDKLEQLTIMKKAALAAECISIGDVVNAAVYRDGAWGCLPQLGMFGAVAPAYYCNGFIPFPKFPEFLGKISTTNKSKRLLRELHAHMWTKTTSSARRLRVSGQLDLMYDCCLDHLVNDGAMGATDTLDFLGGYNLSRDHLVEHLTALRLDGQQTDKYADLDSATKSALTRQNNKDPGKMKLVLTKSKKEKGTGGGDAHDVDPDRPVGEWGEKPDDKTKDDEEGDEEESPDKAKAKEDKELKALMKKKPKARAKGKAKSKSKPK